MFGGGKGGKKRGKKGKGKKGKGKGKSKQKADDGQPIANEATASDLRDTSTGADAIRTNVES